MCDASPALSGKVHLQDLGQTRSGSLVGSAEPSVWAATLDTRVLPVGHVFKVCVDLDGEGSDSVFADTRELRAELKELEGEE